MSTKRNPRTRSQTQQALNEVRHDIAARPALGQQDLTAQRQRAANAMKSVSELDISKTMQKFASAGLDVQKLLTEISSTFSEQFNEVKIVQEAVEAYRQELETLFGKDVILSDLKDVLAEHDAKMAEFKQKFADAQAEHNRKIAELNQQYSDRATQLERELAQNEADYAFERDQKRREEELAYAEKRRIEEKQIAERQAALTAQENELKSLRDQVAGFDERLKKETAAAVSIAVNTRTKDLTNEFALAKKDLEAQLALANANTTNLAQRLSASESRNTALETQVKEANTRIENISKSALDSASGRDALRALQENAQTQSGSSQPTRR
jgi:chromosome segregation ATPase